MKKQRFPIVLFALTSGLLLFFACSKKDDNVVYSQDSASELQHYRSLLNSNTLSGREFYKTLKKYEELVRDSIIKSPREEKKAN